MNQGTAKPTQWQYAQRDHRSACTSGMRSLIRVSAWSSDSDQTAQMGRLIWVFAVQTGHLLSFVVSSSLSFIQMQEYLVMSLFNSVLCWVSSGARSWSVLVCNECCMKCCSLLYTYLAMSLFNSVLCWVSSGARSWSVLVCSDYWTKCCGLLYTYLAMSLFNSVLCWVSSGARIWSVLVCSDCWTKCCSLLYTYLAMSLFNSVLCWVSSGARSWSVLVCSDCWTKCW